MERLLSEAGVLGREDSPNIYNVDRRIFFRHLMHIKMWKQPSGPTSVRQIYY